MSVDCAYSLKPFLKWAGGKRWLTANHANLIPQKFNRYIEPFLGSGAVFFYLNPQAALLGDLNKELIETYRGIQIDWKSVVHRLQIHQRNHSHDYYYRQRLHKPKTISEKAARFIYLNRTCWNGLYRVNLKGEFNVPIGTRSTVLFEDDNFELIANALEKTQLHHCDFEDLIEQAQESDLLFIDPPYTVCHNRNAFVKYNEKLFSWADQERLARSLVRAKERGVIILGTNAYHKEVRKLYRGAFEMRKFFRASSIAGKVSSRNAYEELVIRS